MSRPTLCLLVGAPKCGTSTLYRWLVTHPSIRGAVKKETFFFVDPDSVFLPPASFWSVGWEGFPDAVFGGGPRSMSSEQLLLEGCTHHLYQSEAPKVLAEGPYDVRILALVRPPERRVLSSFQYTKLNLAAVDPRMDFAEFVDLALEDQQRLERRISDPRSRAVLPRDIGYSRYVHYLRHWSDALGPDRVMVLSLEQLRGDPRGVLCRLSDWLGVDRGGFAGLSLERHNETRSPRWARLHRLARWLGDRWPTGHPVRDVAGSLYRRLNTTRAPGVLLDRELRALDRLRTFFAEDNRALSLEFSVPTEDW